MLKIEYEAPQNGWMPVKITYLDTEEYFNVSDVPIDPIPQLIRVLGSAMTGFGGEVWWHIEPAGYYLNLHADHGKFSIKLEYSLDSKKTTRETIFEFIGGFQETIIPVWRSLRKLQSYNSASFLVPDKEMDAITKQIKAMQQC